MPDPTMQRLREAARAAQDGRPLPPDVAGWFIAGAQRYEAAAEAGGAIGLDVALGLGQPGAHGWWTREARERRDGLLRQLRRERFGNLDDAEAARQIALMVRGVHHPLMTAALRCGLGVPGARQLRAILVGEKASKRMRRSP